MARSFINPKLGPPVPKEERVTDVWLILKEVAVGVLPLFLLIGFTLGSILAGLATPTEAAGIGALGAVILSVCYRRSATPAQAGLHQRHDHLEHGAAPRGHLQHLRRGVRAHGTANWITNAMVALPVPPIVMLAFVIILIFLLGWPFECRRSSWCSCRSSTR